MRTTDQSRSTLPVILQPVSVADRDHFMAMAEQHFRRLNVSFVPQEDWRRYYLDNILRNPRLSLRWIMVEGERAGFILFGLERPSFSATPNRSYLRAVCSPGVSAQRRRA